MRTSISPAEHLDRLRSIGGGGGGIKRGGFKSGEGGGGGGGSFEGRDSKGEGGVDISHYRDKNHRF